MRWKKIVAIAMVLCLCLAAALSVWAEDETLRIWAKHYPRGKNEESPDALWYAGTNLHFKNGWSHTGFEGSPSGIVIGEYSTSSTGGPVVYCSEPNGHLPSINSSSYVTETVIKESATNYWKAYEDGERTAEEIIRSFSLVLKYGYQGQLLVAWDRTTIDPDGAKYNEQHMKDFCYWCATSALVWETVVGERDAFFNKTSPGTNVVMDLYPSTHFVKTKGKATFDKYYSEIESKVQEDLKQADFVQTEAIMTWDNTAKQFSAVFKDKNAALARYAFSPASGLTVKDNGDGTLTVSSPAALSEKKTVTGTKSVERPELIGLAKDGQIPSKTVSNDNSQNLVTLRGGTKTFSNSFTLTVSTETGNIVITKVSEDDSVSGVTFTLTGNNTGYTATVVTDGQGKATAAGLPLDTYTVTETNPDSGKYKDTASQQVTLSANGSTKDLEFNNTLRLGGLKIVKTVDNGSPEGFSFSVTGKELIDGSSFEETVTTGRDGTFTLEDLVPGIYTVAEVEDGISSRYILPAPVDFVVFADKTVELPMHNREKPLPPTGDGSRTGLWCSLVLLSAAAVLAMKRRKLSEY